MEMLGRGDVTEWIPDNLSSLRSGEISGMTPVSRGGVICDVGSVPRRMKIKPAAAR